MRRAEAVGWGLGQSQGKLPDQSSSMASALGREAEWFTLCRGLGSTECLADVFLPGTQLMLIVQEFRKRAGSSGLHSTWAP